MSGGRLGSLEGIGTLLIAPVAAMSIGAAVWAYRPMRRAFERRLGRPVNVPVPEPVGDGALLLQADLPAPDGPGLCLRFEPEPLALANTSIRYRAANKTLLRPFFSNDFTDWLAAPEIVIDGHTLPPRWGTWWIPMRPGRAHLEVRLPGFADPRRPDRAPIARVAAELEFGESTVAVECRYNTIKLADERIVTERSAESEWQRVLIDHDRRDKALGRSTTPVSTLVPSGRGGVEAGPCANGSLEQHTETMTDHQLRRTFEWRGRTVAWDRFGDGPAVVLLHGTPWSSALWRPIADALAARFTVHLWDMTGYGDSSKAPEHAVDLGTQGELFADLLSEWGLERPHVIAHDYGGAVALRTRLLHGARYASLCLVDVVALRPWGSPFFRLVSENAEVFERLPPAVHRGAVEAYIRGAAHHGLSEKELAMLVDPWADELGASAFYRQIAQADERYTAEFEERLGEIGEPTRIVWGADDTWIPIDRAHRLHELIPGSTLTIIDGAGHLVQLDAPARLAAELTRWTESVR